MGKIKNYFEGFLDHRKQMGMDQKTLASDKIILYGSLSHSISEHDLESLTLADLALVKAAGREHGEFGPQRSASILRKFFRYLEDSAVTVPFDWRDIEVPRVPKKQNEYLIEEELGRVFSAFDITKLHGLRTRALCEVLFGTGMRISEALSLNIADIDWAKREAVIVNAKTKDRETIRFSERCLYWLRRYLDARKDGMPYLFVSGKGRMPTVTARCYLRTHTKHLGINKHLKNHIFRKSYATHLIEQGEDIIAVRRLLRHKSARTTLRHYAVINQKRSKQVHADIMNKTLAHENDPHVGESHKEDKNQQ
jgi:site-specific recombinase XerD